MITEAARDAEFPTAELAEAYTPTLIGNHMCSRTLQQVATLALAEMVRDLDQAAFNRLLNEVAGRGPHIVRRILELATRDQCESLTPADWGSLVPPGELGLWLPALSAIPSARRHPIIRRHLIECVDPYIALHLLPDLRPAAQRRVFEVLCAMYPSEALQLVEQDVGGIRASLRPTDFTVLAAHEMEEIRIRVLGILHKIPTPPRRHRRTTPKNARVKSQP